MEYKFSDLLNADFDQIKQGIGAAKAAEIAARSAGKVAELERYQEQKENARQQYLNTTSAGALENLIGQNDTAQAVMNGFARAASGTSRLAGDIGNMVVNGFMKGGVTPNNVPNEALDAYKRKMGGVATPEDESILNAPQGRLKTPKYLNPMERQAFEGGGTNLKEIERAMRVSQDSKDVKDFFDLSHLVDRRGDQAAVESLRAAAPALEMQADQAKADWKKGNYLSAAGNFIESKAKAYGNALDTAIDNPGWAAGAVVENAPQLLAGVALGPVGTAVSVGSYATGEYQDAVNDYKKKHGVLPPKDWVSDRQLKAALLAVPEYASDRLTLGAGKVVGAAAKEAGKVVDGLTDGVVKSTLNAAGKVANNMLTRGAAGTGLAGVGEYETESFQQGVEKAMRGEEASFVDKHIAGATGLVAGAGSHVAIPAAAVPSALVSGAKDARQAYKDASVLDTSARKQMDEAVAQKDPSVFLDPKADTYSPDKALAVLHKLATATDTPKAELAKYQGQAKSVLDAFEKQLQVMESGTDEGHATKVKDLEQVQAFLKTIDPTHELYASTKEEEQILLEDVAKGAPTAEQTAARQAKVKELQGKMADAQAVYESLVSSAVGTSLKDVDVPATVSAADSVVAQGDTQGAAKAQNSIKKLVLLSMASPDKVGADVALQLAKNTGNSLSDADRQYLTSFAESTQAIQAVQALYAKMAKTRAKVRDEVLYGDKALNQLGLLGYRERMGKFLAVGDLTRADRLMGGLTNFMAGHQSKLAALEEAYKSFKQTGQEMQVTKDADGNWASAPLDSSIDPRTVGGYKVNNFSGAWIAGVRQEAQAIAATQKALEAAMGLGKVQEAQSNDNTQTVTAQQPADLGTAQEPTEQAPVQTATEATSAPATEPVTEQPAPVPNEGAGTVVESAGVTETPAETVQAADGMKTITATNAGKWLTQKAKGILSTVPNLFSTLIAAGNTDSIEGKVKMVESDVSTLHKVLKLHKTLAPQIESLLKKAHSSVAEDAFIDDLMITKEDGSLGLDENVLIASSLAGLSWLRGTIGNGLYSQDEAINKMLGQPKEQSIPKQVRKELGHGYVRYNVAAASIGKEALAMLGIKGLGNAPANYLARIEVSLGSYILEAMTEAGFAQQKNVKDSVLQSWFGNTSTSPNLSHQFITVAQSSQQKNGRTVPAWAELPKSLANYFKGEDASLNRLFGVESSLKMPTFEPVEFTQNGIKRSIKNVPARLKAYLQKANAVPYKVKQESWGLFMSLSDTLQQKIVGVDHRDASKIHPDNLDSVDAKNAGLIRGIELLKDFVMNTVENSEKGLDQEVFFSHFVQNSQRVGIENAVNMQADKLHRFMFTTQEWDTEISLTDPAAVGMFKLRVLEGFGVKTDAKTAFDSLMNDWFALEENPTIQQGVAAAQKFLNQEELTEADQNAIAQAVAEGGEKVHTFDSLIALAKYTDATQKKQASFTTSVVGEIDGINNGPIMTLILLGVTGLKTLAQKGGFFRSDSGYTNSNHWKANKANLDVYQTATHTFLNLYASHIENNPYYESLFYFTGPLGDSEVVAKAGRNLAKRPNTAFFFGSGKQSLVDGMVENFLADVLKKQEDILAIADPDARQQKINELKQALEPLAKTSGMSTQAMYKDISGKNFESSRTGQELVAAFTEAVAAPFTEVLTSSYQEVSSLRNKITEHSEAMYHLYSAAYDSMKKAMLDDMVSKGEITRDEANRYDLSQEQQQRLKRILKDAEPSVHSMASKEEGNAGLGASLPAIKVKSVGSTNAKYKGKVVYERTSGAKSRTVVGSEETFVEPGVGMLAKQVHSGDSYVSHSVDTAYGSVNAHDARITGLKHYTQVGVELNQAVFELMYSYSPLREIYEARVRQFQALEALQADPEFAGALAGVVQKAESARLEALRKKFPKNFHKMKLTPFTNVAELFALAQEADATKLTEMMEWGFVDQYGNEGGQYDVTEQDRQKIKQLHANLLTNNFIPESVMQTIQKVSGQVPQAYSNEAPTNRVFSDPDLTVFFREEGSLPVKEALGYLQTLLAQRNEGNTFNSFLLDQLKDLVGDVTVTLVKDRTSVAQGLFAEKSRGWTDAAGNVYLLDPSQSHSGLTTELVLHEVVHSVLRHILDNPNAQQKASVEALQTLLNQVSARMNKAGKADQFKAALSNLQEFVAWGMTNKDFQTELARMGSNQTKNAFRRFVEKVSSLVFGSDPRMASAAIESSFGDFMGHVAQLMETAKDQTPSNGLPNGDLLSMAASPDYYTTASVFAGLTSNGNSTGFVATLGGVVDHVVNRLHGPYGAIKSMVQNSVGSTPADAWAHAQATGQRVLASKALTAGLKFSEKESFVTEQVEAVMTLALDEKAPSNSVVYAELDKLYTQAKSVLKGKIADDLYRFVFVPQAGMGGKSDYMSRFVALGLGNEVFHSALAFETQKPQLVWKGKTFMERLEMAWRAAVDALGAWRTKTFQGQQGNEKLYALVHQLVQSELKAREQANKGKSLTDLMEPLDSKMADAIQGARNVLVNVTGSKMIKNSRFGPVKLAGTVANLVATDRVAGVIQGISKVRNETFSNRPGTAMELLNYANGVPQWVNTLALIAKKVEKDRMFVTKETSRAVLAAFDQGGKGLNTQKKAAITSVLLRTGAHYLLASHGVAGLQKLLEDPKALQQAIDTEVAALVGYPEGHYYIKQAKGLAMYLAEGVLDVENQLFNAGNISKAYLTGRSVPAHAEQAQPVIERLISLYGLSYSDMGQKNLVRNIMRIEAARGGDNGVEMSLLMHQHLEKEAKSRLFADSEALMIHGYLPEVLNPHTAFEVTRDPEEAALLEERGYVRHSLLSVDKADPEPGTPVLYVLKGGGLGRYQSGMVSFTGMQAKGAAKHDSFYNPNSPEGVANMQSMSHIYAVNQAAVAKQFSPDPSYNPSQQRRNKRLMAPLLNRQGQVVDYRYMMDASTKDTLLERNNDFDHLLGVLAGSTFDKETSRESNKQIMKALHEHWKTEYPNSPADFIHVHKSSSDADMREVWNMIPSATKQDIEASWGSDGIWVPKALVTPLFGYRKASLADSFDKENKNAAEKLMVSMVSGILYTSARVSLKGEDKARKIAKRGGIYTRRAEMAWEEVVKEAKDIIVVKTGTVALYNILSNQLMLKMHGLSMKEIVKYQHEALKGAMDYERDSTALAQLKAQLDTGYNIQDLDALKGEIVRLENAIARNPVKELEDAGLMSTIVEDVASEDDPYSYKSRLNQWVDGKASKIHPRVLGAIRGAYMSHDTTAYKFMFKATQYSDFVARYALFKHQTTRKNNPLSKADALYQASEVFINYDLALPKWVQYGNDIGLLMFFKYFLSVQRVLGRVMKHHPLHVMNTLALNSFLGDWPTPLDSSVLTRVGSNPLSMGALNYFSALPDLATVQGAMSLVK